MVGKGNGFGKRGVAADKPAPLPYARPAEKRLQHRTVTFKNAKIEVRKDVAVDCAVRDLSATGCLVSLRIDESLPKEFVIVLGPALLRRRARLVWRKNLDCGLEFVTG